MCAALEGIGNFLKQFLQFSFTRIMPEGSHYSHPAKRLMWIVYFFSLCIQWLLLNSSLKTLIQKILSVIDQKDIKEQVLELEGWLMIKSTYCCQGTQILFSAVVLGPGPGDPMALASIGICIHVHIATHWHTHAHNYK